MIRINTKPISVNKAYRGGRRFKTKDYLHFEKDMLSELASFGNIQKISGRYKMHIKFYMKNATGCDISNFIKTTEDIIVKAGLVDDDRYCVLLVAEKEKSDIDYFEFELVGV